MLSGPGFPNKTGPEKQSRYVLSTSGDENLFHLPFDVVWSA